MKNNFQENLAISLTSKLLKEVWTPSTYHSNEKLQKLSHHAVFLLLGESLPLGVDQMLDNALNHLSDWELKRNQALINDFHSPFYKELENWRKKPEKELKLKEDKEFKEFLQNIFYFESLSKHTTEKIPLIFLYRAQNHFIDALNYVERGIFRSYEIAKILNHTFNLQPALQVLGFGSLKEFYVSIFLIFNVFSQKHGIFDLLDCNINIPDSVKAQRIRDLLNKVLNHSSFSITFLKNSYQEMLEKKLHKEFLPFSHFNPFVKKPLLKVDEKKFLCPDPKCILAYASWGLLSEIRNVL